MIRFAVVDDQITYIEQIEQLIAKYLPAQQEYHIDTFTNSEVFLQAVATNSYDIIYMDIEMPTVSGIQCATVIKQQCPSSIVIFVTSHTSYVADVFRLGAFQFLHKPINQQDFAIDLARAVTQHNSNHTSITVKTHNGICVVKYIDIVYIEVLHKQITIHTTSGSVTSRASLRQYIEILPTANFVMVHKSYLVNMNHISRIDATQLLLTGGEVVPLSRNYKQRFLAQFGVFARGVVL